MTDAEERRINQWNIDSERSERVMHPSYMEPRRHVMHSAGASEARGGMGR